MVRIRPGGHACAAREGAASVAGNQRSPLFGVDQPLSWFRIQGRAVIVEQDGGEEAVTPEESGLRYRQWSEPGHVPDIKIGQVQ